MRHTKTLHAKIERRQSRLEIRFDDQVLFFEKDCGEPAFSDHDDFAVWALLPMAMESGRNLKIESAVHEETIRAAEKICHIWHLWMPPHFLPVHVDAAQVMKTSGDSPERTQGALLALSGGIDSTYALLRHKEALNITRTLTVHGFDIPLDKRSLFRDLAAKAQGISRKAGVSNLVLRTNVRNWVSRWEPMHMLPLTAALTVFNDCFTQLLASSSYTLEKSFLMHPWGTNFVTDSLLTAGGWGVDVLDSTVDRIEKVQYILDYKDYLPFITVCYKNKSSGNCGKCMKCILVKLYMHAFQDDVSALFPHAPLTDKDIGKFKKYRYEEIYRASMENAIGMARRAGRKEAERMFQDILRAQRRNWRAIAGFNNNHAHYLKLRNFIRRLKGKPALGHGLPEEDWPND